MKYILSLCATIVFIGQLSAANYQLNEAHVNQLFENSIDASPMFNQLDCSADYAKNIATLADEGKSQTTAAIIAFAVTIAGGAVIGVAGSIFLFPIFCLPLIWVPWHRIYLGTGGETFKISALYCVTLSWCGWLGIIDGVMLLVDESKSKYIDNPKYVMWID